MPRFSSRAAILAGLVATWAVVVFAQARVDPRLLAVKKTFADQQQASLAVPFTGVRTADGPRPGLFPVRATGVSTEPLRAAADAFLATLTPAQINRDIVRYDEQLYFFTMLGQPSATEPWGWQLEGHHLVVNYFVLGDRS